MSALHTPLPLACTTTARERTRRQAAPYAPPIHPAPTHPAGPVFPFDCPTLPSPAWLPECPSRIPAPPHFSAPRRAASPSSPNTDLVQRTGCASSPHTQPVFMLACVSALLCAIPPLPALPVACNCSLSACPLPPPSACAEEAQPLPLPQYVTCDMTLACRPQTACSIWAGQRCRMAGGVAPRRSGCADPEARRRSGALRTRVAPAVPCRQQDGRPRRARPCRAAGRMTVWQQLRFGGLLNRPAPQAAGVQRVLDPAAHASEACRMRGAARRASRPMGALGSLPQLGIPVGASARSGRRALRHSNSGLAAACPARCQPRRRRQCRAGFGTEGGPLAGCTLIAE